MKKSSQIRLKIIQVTILVLLGLQLSACSMMGIEAPNDSAVYIVQKGDTLYDIGHRFGVTQTELIKVNHLKDARSIQIGQPLEIPQRGRLNIKESQSGHAGDSGGPKRLKLKGAREYLNNLSWPVKVTRFGSPFGYRDGKFHDGVDLIAPEGFPILAAHSAEVQYAGHQLSGYGNIIVLRAGNLLTIYAHNSHNLVSTGDSVERGDKIGEVGMTGRATGPHLHFEVRLLGDDGKYYAVDPLKFLK